MALLLAHTILLTLASYATASRLIRAVTDRVLATLLLVWANLVATSLLLSCVRQLGDPAWFFRGSLLLAFATWWLLRRVPPESATPPPPTDTPHRGLLVAFCVTLLPVVWIGLQLASTYEPNNYDSLTYHLPRAMYYMGQGNLAHFDTGNPRQIYFPFNYNLLQLAGLIYSAPVQAVNFINLAAWAAAGLALYRLCRLCTFGANAALTATWLTLMATQVLAQATATTNDLPTGVGLITALTFALRWRHSGQTRDALLAGVAAGLAIGSKLTVVFFAPAGGLILLFLAWRHAQNHKLPEFFRGVRAWLFPALLAGLLAAPFAAINIAEKGEWINHSYDFTLNRPFSIGCVAQTSEAYLVQLFLEPLHRFTFDLQITAELNAWGTRTFFPHWNEAYAFAPLYLFPPDLNEDHVWFGFTGPAILLAAFFCLLRCRRAHVPAAWLAWLGLGWFATYFILNKWSLYNQRYFVPAILVLGPCLAAVIEAGWRNPRLYRTTRNLVLLLAVSSLWLAGVYLFKNTSRPYAPLWAGQPPPPALPALPPLLVQRLAGEPRINIDTTDGNERTFLFMNLGRHQRFTSFDRTDPDAYNLFSHWGFVRKVAYSNIEQLSSYTIVNLPAKRTAGVEFLGTIGSGQPALDYYGLAPHPETLPATESNRNAMVVFYYGPRDPGRYAKLRIKAAGLNAADHARLRVGVDFSDGSSETLATFTANGEAWASVTRPIKRFTVRVNDAASDAALGQSEVPYFAREDPPDFETPLDPTSLFADELISPAPKTRIVTTGLAPAEGPYPQWDLPLIRWAKAPVLRLEIPPQKHLDRIEFAFDLRLHIREAAQFDVRFNGEIVATYDWANRTGWFIRRLTFTPIPDQPNVIEIRSVTLGTEPDWLDYLERYPDIKAYVLSQHIPLVQGAREHYEAFGRKENRALHLQRHIETLSGDPLYYMFRTLRVAGFRDL
jgi:4-amino-4-deoxy-L-arabinose transferase-like glycosyltransferase